jgi:nitroreductase
MEPEDLADLMKSRRSSLLIDAEREVPREIVEHLCELVTWAPNHKRTWPWRIAVVGGESRRELGERISIVMAALGDDEPKVAKTRTKYLRSPHVVVIGADPGDSAERTAENRYAVAAGIQNMLLAAHAHGLAALWGSPARGANATITELCHFPTDTEILGLVYLGWPTKEQESPGRPEPDITWL